MQNDLQAVWLIKVNKKTTGLVHHFLYLTIRFYQDYLYMHKRSW